MKLFFSTKLLFLELGQTNQDFTSNEPLQLPLFVVQLTSLIPDLFLVESHRYSPSSKDGLIINLFQVQFPQFLV